MKKEKIISLITIMIISLSILIPNKVKAMTVVDPTFVGKKTESKWTISANGSITGEISAILTQENNAQTTLPNFLWVDVCTSGYEPTLWITMTTTMRPSTKWYKVNTPCYVGPNNEYEGTVYRQIIYLTDFMDYGVNQKRIVGTGQLFSNTNYNVYMRLYRMGTSYNVPLDDLAYDNDLTQTTILRQILNEVITIKNMQDRVKQAVDQQTQDINNVDYTGQIDQQDTTQFNNFNQGYGQLKSTMNQANMNSLQIAIDTNSSSFVWNTITSILNAHTLLMGVFISILSIGVLKQILGR